MADTKFSALPAAGTLDGTEIVPVVKTTGKQTTTQAIADINNTANRSRANHTGTQTLSTISDAGTAASKNIPAVGNASATEVVLGSDTRLSDARTPTTHSHAESDVTGLVTDLSNKSNVGHTHTASNVTDFNSAALAAAPAETATTVGSLISGATSKTTPVDADSLGLSDSAATNVLKKLTWANVKATLKTYFDTLYANITHTHAESDITNLVSDLAGKSSTSHTHTLDNLSDVIITTPSTGQVVKYNGTNWVNDTDATGGAGSTPGGSDTQIQFNDAGAFGGDADFTWNKTTNDLVLGGTDTGITLKGITTEPSAPAADNLHIYSKKIAGKMIPKIKGPSGLDSPLQVALWQNNITIWTPSSATAGTWQGTISTTTSAGTYTVGVPTTTSLYTATTRGRYANVVTTTNQILGIRHTANPTYFLGNTAGRGGFFFFARVGFDVWTNGARMFVGLSANAAGTTVSADPSATNNTVGFCVDAADAGAISFLMRGTAATKTATGYTITSGKGYDLFMWAAPNSTTVNYRIIDINAGTEATGTVSTNAPAVNTMMGPNVLASNAALTPVTSVQIGINRLYIETDY